MKVFVCHHIRAIERKQYLLDNLILDDSFDIIWVENFLPEDITNYVKGNLTLPELSLFLKHRYIWEKIVSDDIDYAIIIEDDILIDTDINTYLKRCMNDFIDANGDIIFIGGIPDLKVQNTNETDMIYTQPGYTTRCTHLYAVNKKTAKTILENLNYNKPADHFLNDIILDNNLKCYWTYPHIEQKTVIGLEKSIIR